jgi:metallophosphoesterase (TIGR00282 family)
MMLGDVVGEAGVAAVEQALPVLRKNYSASLVVLNGENASEGFGMTARMADRLFAAGADVITSGNHIWEKRDFLPYMEDHAVLRPANYFNACGRGFIIMEHDSMRWLIVNLQGRVFMTAIDCPFRTVDSIISAVSDESNPLPLAVVVDFHAESTREKEALAMYLDGRAFCIAGTHTHVQTADERLLPKGSAYITDLGMCGPHNSVIGMDTDLCIKRAETQVFHKLSCAEGEVSVQGIVCTATLDDARITVQKIERFCHNV